MLKPFSTIRVLELCDEGSLVQEQFLNYKIIPYSCVRLGPIDSSILEGCIIQDAFRVLIGQLGIRVLHEPSAHHLLNQNWLVFFLFLTLFSWIYLVDVELPHGFGHILAG
jgi:hypothetical protein